MTRIALTIGILSSLFLGAFASLARAQLNTADQRVVTCSAGLKTSIDGTLKGKIGAAYEEGDVVGDEFIMEQLGSIFKDASPAERIELFKIYTACLKSESNQGQPTGLGYPEPLEAEMFAAHADQVSPIALQMLPITHFVKEGCTVIQSRGYECSYQIRAGSYGPPKLVTNTFAKTGSKWIMRLQ